MLQSEYYDHQGIVVDSVSPISDMDKRHHFVTKHSIQRRVRPGKLVLQSVSAKPTGWVKHPQFSEYHSESFSVTEKERLRHQPLHFPESDTRSLDETWRRDVLATPKGWVKHPEFSEYHSESFSVTEKERVRHQPLLFPESDTRSLIKTQRRDVLTTPTAGVKNPEFSEYHSERFSVTEKEGLRHQPSHLPEPCPSHLALPSLSCHKNERQQKVKGRRHQPSRLPEPGTSHLASPSLSCHPNERQQKVKVSPKSQKIDTLPYHEPDAVDDKTAGEKRELDSLKSKPSICEKKLSESFLEAVERKFLLSRAMKAFRAQFEVRANAVNHPTAELHQIKQHALGPLTDALPTEPSTSITLSSLHDPLSADNVRKRRECPTQFSIKGERV